MKLNQYKIKDMKKLVLQLLFLLPVCVFSQSHSWDGNGIRSNEKIHYLNIFVNIIYDVHPECNDRFQNEQYWPPFPTLRWRA